MPHPHMVLDLDECEQLTSLPQKNTLIMATCQSPMNVFMWSIFSILLRSQRTKLEHFMVNINGGDSRCGPTELQDKKQKFLEELRLMKWQGHDMPLTVIRVWNRIGHAQALEMSIPWVHTEYYTIMHDDVILLDNKWCDEVWAKLYNDPGVAFCYHPPLLMGGVRKAYYENAWLLGMPHLNSTFVACRKSAMQKANVQWRGYHVKVDFHLDKFVDVKEFLEHHQNNNDLSSYPLIEAPYKFLSMDIGAWAYERLKEAGFRFVALPEKTLLHLGAISWGSEQNAKDSIGKHREQIQALEKDIDASEFGPLYRKYL